MAESIQMWFGWPTFVGHRDHILDGFQDPPTGLSGQVKRIGSPCCGVCSKRDHLFVNNGMQHEGSFNPQ